jgi:hypothetical protein
MRSLHNVQKITMAEHFCPTVRILQRKEGSTDFDVM